MRGYGLSVLGIAAFWAPDYGFESREARARFGLNESGRIIEIVLER